jgi:hypothetical protein
MTRLRLLLAAVAVLTTLVATVPAAAQPGGNPIPGSGGVFELAWTGDISPPSVSPAATTTAPANSPWAANPTPSPSPATLSMNAAAQPRSPHPSATTAAGVASTASATSLSCRPRHLGRRLGKLF